MRLDAERLQHAIRDEQRARLLRISKTGDCPSAVAIEADLLEDATFVAIREELRRRHAELGEVDAGRRVLEADELLGVRIRQRLDQHAIDHGEDRGVRADAQGQRQDDRKREPGTPPHAAHGLAQIAAERIEQADRVHAIDLLADPHRVPKLDVCRPLRRVTRHATRDVLVGFDLEVRAQLLGAIAIPVRSAEEPAPAHGYSVEGLRILPMARTISSQRVVCAASCLRPVGVSR